MGMRILAASIDNLFCTPYNTTNTSQPRYFHMWGLGGKGLVANLYVFIIIIIICMYMYRIIALIWQKNRQTLCVACA